MSATYFTKGREHSLRGAQAREDGGMAWSKLPAKLRRGLTSKQATVLQISGEWHHAGKYASEVYVYYPEQVQAFWGTLEESGYGVAELSEAVERRHELAVGTDDDTHEWITSRLQALQAARNVAEEVRQEVTGE